MRRTAENLRYLLWREKVKRHNWVEHMASWAGCDKYRAEALLNDELLQSDEQSRIAEITGCSVDDLQNSRFVGDEVDVLYENIKFLTDKNITGEKLTDIERKTGISRITLSRWRIEDAKKRPTPERPQLAKLAEHFNLPPGTNLHTDPVFLALLPVGPVKQKEWLYKQIDHMSAKDLRDLLPALKRLFKDS